MFMEPLVGARYYIRYWKYKGEQDGVASLMGLLASYWRPVDIIRVYPSKARNRQSANQKA